MRFVRFTGASMLETDEGYREYLERGPIYVNPQTVTGFYDHTILTSSGHKIRVMEDLEHIKAKLVTGG